MPSTSTSFLISANPLAPTSARNIASTDFLTMETSALLESSLWPFSPHWTPAAPAPQSAMSKDRREFLKQSALGLAAPRSRHSNGNTQADPQTPPELPPGAPPAFGTGPKVGPPDHRANHRRGRKAHAGRADAGERKQARGNWQVSMAPQYERRTGPRKVAIDPTTAPASRWDPSSIPGAQIGAKTDQFQTSSQPAKPLPHTDADIAYAGIHDQAHWIQTKQLTSQRLTTLYLERLEKFQPRINAVITLTRDLAMAQAKRADQEIASGTLQGPAPRHPLGREGTSSTPRTSPPPGAPSLIRTEGQSKTQQ
jgi:hypothetical protein